MWESWYLSGKKKAQEWTVFNISSANNQIASNPKSPTDFYPPHDFSTDAPVAKEYREAIASTYVKQQLRLYLVKNERLCGHGVVV